MTLNSRETDQHLLDSYGAPTACWSPFRQQSDVPGSLKEPPAWHAAAHGFRSRLQLSTDGTCALLQWQRVWDQLPPPPSMTAKGPGAAFLFNGCWRPPPVSLRRSWWLALLFTVSFLPLHPASQSRAGLWLWPLVRGHLGEAKPALLLTSQETLAKLLNFSKLCL